MKIDGKTKVCGILARPVEHSMSPLLQNLFAEKTGVNLTYVPFKVEETDLEAAVKGALSLNIHGLNVTVPHKQQVMNYLDEIDKTAEEIGAVNTLVRTEQGFKGYNTDVPGLLRAVTKAGMVIKDRSCILIGAGGAAKAAAYMMAKEGAAVIYLLNRSIEKAEKLALYLNKLFGKNLIKPLALSDYQSIPKGRYFAVQSTSVGMYPFTNQAPIEDPEFYQLIEEAIDIIYNPVKTKFMEYVEASGGRAVNGLNMLLYQGVISYELWNPGFQVGSDAIYEARLLIEKKLSEEKASSDYLILTGFMGAGKTSVGLKFSEKHNIPMIDTDKLIEEQAGMTISEMFAVLGESAFREMETQCLKELLEEKKKRGRMILSVGGGLPLIEENRELLKKLGTVIYLKVSPDTVLDRLKGDLTRPLLQGGSGRERIEALLAYREPLYEAAAHEVISVDGKDFSQIIQDIEIVLEKGGEG